MSLIQAIKALPGGTRHVFQFYYPAQEEWGFLMWELRQPLAGFLEKTLLSETEEPVEAEVDHWYREFEELQQSSGNQGFSYQCKFPPPIKLYNAFKYCLKQEMKFLEESWLNIANARCSTLHDRIVSGGINFQDVDSEAYYFDFPTTTIAVLTEQQLEPELNDLVNTICWCVSALLEYRTDFRPSYFSSMSPKFQHWGKYYQERLETVQQIRSFLQNFFAMPFLWQGTGQFTEPIQRMRHLSEKVDTAMKKLVSQALIVTQEPHVTVKKESKFDLEVKIFGTKFLQVEQASVPVPTVINESQAEALYRDGLLNEAITVGCGKIQPCKSPSKPPTRTHDPDNQTTTIFYERMSIPERPTDNSRTRAVLKQKFVVLFHTELLLDGVPVRAWACSTPFVYTTNVSQDCEASATIFWDSYVLYKTPFNISLAKTAKLWEFQAGFSRYIKKETRVCWELNQHSLSYVAEKLLGAQPFLPDYLINRAMIDEYKNAETGVTFWEWFMGTMKLLKDVLSMHWQQGHIIGYIARDMAESILEEDGTFLLRFPSSEVGRLCLTWRCRNGAFSTILPTNDKGELAADLNQIILGMNGISKLLTLHTDPATGRGVMKDKYEVFPLNSATNILEQLPAPGKKPYVPASMALQLGDLMQRRASESSTGSLVSSTAPWASWFRKPGLFQPNMPET